MTALPMDAEHPDPIELLGRAVSYTRECLQPVRDADLDRPTPCRGWDLRQLLRHMDDSLTTLIEAAALGEVALLPDLTDSAGGADSAGGLLLRLRIRACALLAAWSSPAPCRVTIADGTLPAGLLAGIGALEVTAHGWDVAQTLDRPRPVPAGLAGGLLPLVDIVVTEDDRPHRFGYPIGVRPTAAPGARLLAALGRRP